MIKQVKVFVRQQGRVEDGDILQLRILHGRFIFERCSRLYDEWIVIVCVQLWLDKTDSRHGIHLFAGDEVCTEPFHDTLKGSVGIILYLSRLTNQCHEHDLGHRIQPVYINSFRKDLLHGLYRLIDSFL